jgi:hypothetical protein
MVRHQFLRSDQRNDETRAGKNIIFKSNKRVVLCVARPCSVVHTSEGCPLEGLSPYAQTEGVCIRSASVRSRTACDFIDPKADRNSLNAEDEEATPLSRRFTILHGCRCKCEADRASPTGFHEHAGDSWMRDSLTESRISDPNTSSRSRARV